MSTTETAAAPGGRDVMGHPRQLWMLFMTEFWERFAFYGIRWALVLYVVAHFHNGDGAFEKPANELYGAYLALVYGSAIFGGYMNPRWPEKPALAETTNPPPRSTHFSNKINDSGSTCVQSRSKARTMS